MTHARDAAVRDALAVIAAVRPLDN